MNVERGIKTAIDFINQKFGSDYSYSIKEDGRYDLFEDQQGRWIGRFSDEQLHIWINGMIEAYHRIGVTEKTAREFIEMKDHLVDAVSKQKVRTLAQMKPLRDQICCVGDSGENKTYGPWYLDIERDMIICLKSRIWWKMVDVDESRWDWRPAKAEDVKCLDPNWFKQDVDGFFVVDIAKGLTEDELAGPKNREADSH